nr:uncharacterized protein LOC129269408 isoform X1 [Lytechinus pictus]
MDIQQAPEIRAKPRDADRGGAGDVDNNTPVYHDTNQANMNAETDGMHNKHADRSTQLLDPAAQGAQLCLLASKSQKSNVYKAYDRTRRARSFIPHWVVEYPWLEFNPEKECMFCIYCREYQKIHDAEFTNTFVHGATNFRLDSVKAHDNSTKHRQVMLVMSGKISIIPKPMSKLPRATGDRLRVGSFFDTEVNDGSYDVNGVGSASHPSMHRPTEVIDDEGGQKHNIPSSSDLLEEPFSTPNPMAKYIKTLQNIYPHLPLNGVSSENCQPTNILQQQPSQLTTPPPSRVGDAAPQGMEMEENIEVFIIKEEPLSPGQEEQAQGNYEREPGVEDAPSTSTGGGGKIGRAVPPMRKVWNVTTNGAASLSQEEDGVDQGNDYEQTGNDTSDHLDQDHEDEAAEGLLHHPGAMQDFFINPVVPVMRQGRRTTRLLPKAKRQKLEMLMARQMHGEDVNNISDDSSGDPRFHFDQEGDLGSGKSSSNDSQWKQLAESFLTKYNQLSEAHSIMMKQFQSKIAKLESKCKELEESRSSRQRAPASNSNQENQDGIPGQKEASGSSQSSPRINMYSSVIILQLQGREPINISSTSDNNFSVVQESLSQSGIHISLGASNIPNTLEEQVSNLSRPVQRSLSKAGSPTTSSETTAVISDNVSRYSRARDSNQVSGVGSTVQNESEIQHSGHENLSSDRRGYLMGNGVADGSAPSECQPPAPGRTDSTSHNAAGDLSCDSVSHSNNPAVVLRDSLSDCTVDQHSDEHEKIAFTSASSTADDMV